LACGIAVEAVTRTTQYGKDFGGAAGMRQRTTYRIFFYRDGNFRHSRIVQRFAMQRNYQFPGRDKLDSSETAAVKRYGDFSHP
jgi:hypothetical protein